MEKKVSFALTRRRECPVPTWRGWLLLVSILALLSVVTVRELHPFLAVTEPVKGGLLVVEGWVSDAAMESAIAEFKGHRYEKVCVTGGPIEHGAWMGRYNNFADQGAATLVAFGLDRDDVRAVPSKSVRRDRTNAAAAAFGKWMRNGGAVSRTVHLITEGPHARRSRLLFQRALGSGITVGVTSVPKGDYDPENWWRSSAGVREVIGELLAYGYARCLFWLAEE